MSEPIDLGDGLTVFRAGITAFRVDLWAWAEWYDGYRAPEGAGPYDHLHAVRAKLKRETGAELNVSQADDFLHKVLEVCANLKKKQGVLLTSASSTGPAPPP